MPLDHRGARNGTLSRVGRLRLIAPLAGVVLVALLAPQAAFAGTYSWTLPGDPGTFTGSNPEHKYGTPSWTYELDGAPFTAADFSSGTWSDGMGDSIGNTGTAITMNARQGHSVAISWTNPSGETGSVTSTFANTGGLLCGSALRPPPPVVSAGGTITVTLSGSVGGACSASGTISITVNASAPAVTLASPANGSTINEAQPVFGGTAATGFGNANAVTVHVYGGTSASGTPVENLQAAVTGSSGSYAVTPSPDLGSGTYTAQTEQDDLAGDVGLSSPVTFTLIVTPPTVTLNSLGSAPLHTSTPTFTGTAGTGPANSGTVYIGIFSGTSTTGSPVTFLSGSVGSDGHFSIPASSGLTDGQYTAYAAQGGGGGAGYSSNVTFSIKVHGPALTLQHPSPGASVGRDSLAFSGQAGHVYGDLPTITVYLYRGTRLNHLLGNVHAKANGSSWSVGWPKRLGLGFYTAEAVQSDDAGHTTRTRPHTFLLVPNPKVVGSRLTLNRSGSVSVPVGCAAPAGQTCSGSVLVVTQGSFRSTPGGPFGRLEVLFAFVQIPGGTTEVIRGSAPPGVASTLNSKHQVSVAVTLKLSKSGGGAVNETVGRTLTIT